MWRSGVPKWYGVTTPVLVPVRVGGAPDALSPTLTAPPPRSARFAWSFVAVSGVAVALAAVGPEWLQSPLILLATLVGTGAMIYGVRRVARPGHRGPWRLLLGAALLFLVGIILRAVVPGAGLSPPTNAALIPDAFTLPGYLLMTAAFAGMLRRRRAREDDPARIDAILVALAAAFVSWTYLIVPSMEQTDLTTIRLANSFFPILDVVLLVFAAQLAFSGGARTPSLWLLMLAVTAMFGGDLIFVLRDGQLANVPEHPIDVLFMATFLLVGAAQLHPSMRSLTEPQQIVVNDLGKLRTTLIAMTVVVPNLITTVQPADSMLSGIVNAALCSGLILAVFARVVRANNSRARAEQVTRRRATHDALTDLPNRELLSETITRWGDRTEEDQQEISLLFIDLDRFKMVNDHWGHQVGDELLCAVAGRLSTQIRGEDLVCRIGGDEFVIALASPSHSALAESLADRVLDEFSRPFELSVGNVVISASIGVAKANGGARALELIRDADTAMYKAKGNGRNAYALFDTSLRDKVRDRMNLEQALRRALPRGELAVHFQPIVDLTDGQIDGFEALMRWNHPTLGAVSPVDFIPVAEDTGLIVESGAWLLREAASQLATWTAQRGPGARRLHVSVNVSVRQLRDSAIVDIVRSVLADTGIGADQLWLEITESGVMEDLESALVTLLELRDLGITLCIDDFGTGYSSLSYLNRLPVGIVKIDRSFVRHVGENGPNEPIVRAVLAMTRAMNLRVVAEGVETELQRDWLRDQGCDLAQGWLYGKADLPQNLDQWIRPQVTA
jgi:diguanylate cyclase (GGDEF)-like protein